jgi:DNA-binding XRE family transcriptional regulator
MRQLLKNARMGSGMTQRETATAIGVSERTYQRIEAGTREGKARVWDKLETLFGLPQRQLRGDCGNDTTIVWRDRT